MKRTQNEKPKTLLETLAEEVSSGKITFQEALTLAHQAGLDRVYLPLWDLVHRAKESVK